MKQFSRADIEAIAKRILKIYSSLPELSDKPIRKIDPERLATQVLQLKLDYAHLSLDGTTLGLTSFDEVGIEVFDQADEAVFFLMDDHTILIEEALNRDCSCVGRRNFTIAHEAAHQIFKMLYPNAYGMQNKSIKPIHFYRPTSEAHSFTRIRDWEEWQANTLASALLMPERIVKEGMFLFGLGEKINILNPLYRKEVFSRFRCLAEFLGVSQQALSIRMKHLGLLDREYLSHPTAFLDIYKE